MEMTTIGESCELHARIGWQGLTKKEYLDEGDYYLVTGVDFNKGRINFKECHYVSKDRYDQDKYIQLHLNDVLVTKDGTIGKVAIIDAPTDKPATLNSGVFVVRPKDPARLLPRYLMMVLLSNHFNRFIERIKVGCTIAHLNQEKFVKYDFPLPSVDEQLKIIRVFDTVFTIINKKKEILIKSDDLVKARFVEMFGDPDTNPKHWSEQLLSEKLNVLGGYAFRSDGFSETGGIPVLRIGNINAGFFKPVNMVFWEEDDILERYIMYPGDLVMSLTGTVGKDDYGNVCILGHEYEKYYLNQRNAKLELEKGLDKHYLSQLLRFEKIKKRLTGISRGVRQANISNRDILNLRVPIPPIELQKQFSNFVTQVDKSKVAIQKSLDETQLLFDSLMQQYFG